MAISDALSSPTDAERPPLIDSRGARRDAPRRHGQRRHQSAPRGPGGLCSTTGSARGGLRRSGRPPLLVLAALAAVLGVRAAGAPAAVPSVPVTPVTPVTPMTTPRPIVLPNGARLVVEERPSTETVSILLLVGGGLLEEPGDRRGLSTVHTRLLLRGSETRSGAEIARAAEEIGGRLDAWTGLRHEAIAIDLPAGASLAPAMRLVAEIALHPRLEPSDLEKEKGILASAIASSLDDPSSYLDDEIARTLFPGHPLSRLARLTEEEVARLALDDLRAWRRARLVGSNVALVVVGRCESGDVERTAREVLGPIPAAAGSQGREGAKMPTENAGKDAPALLSALSPLPPPSPLHAEIHKRVRKRTTQPEISLALPIPGVPDEDAPALAILRHVLGGFQERLSAEIREKRGYAYWVRLEGRFLPTAGWIGVRTGAKKKHLPEIETLIRGELDRILTEPPSAEELERARRYLMTSEARTDATNASRASSLATAIVEGRPLRTYEEKVARLAVVTPDQVRDLAGRLLPCKRGQPAVCTEDRPAAVLTLY